MLFLASDDSSHVNAVELMADGGATGAPFGAPILPSRVSAILECMRKRENQASVTADRTTVLASGLPDSVRFDIGRRYNLAHRRSRACSPDSLL